MRFDWDENKAAANLTKHGISFNDASTVFGDALSWTYPDSDHSEREERWITIGISDKHQILVVFHAEDAEERIRIFSARRATNRERKFYEER